MTGSLAIVGHNARAFSQRDLDFFGLVGERIGHSRRSKRAQQGAKRRSALSDSAGSFVYENRY
jgi:hypothetical protein